MYNGKMIEGLVETVQAAEKVETRSGHEILESVWNYLRDEGYQGQISEEDAIDLFLIFKQRFELFISISVGLAK